VAEAIEPGMTMIFVLAAKGWINNKQMLMTAKVHRFYLPDSLTFSWLEGLPLPSCIFCF